MARRSDNNKTHKPQYIGEQACASEAGTIVNTAIVVPGPTKMQHAQHAEPDTPHRKNKDIEPHIVLRTLPVCLT